MEQITTAGELLSWIKTHTRPLRSLCPGFEMRELPNGVPIVVQWWDDKNGFEVYVQTPNAVRDFMRVLDRLMTTGSAFCARSVTNDV